MHILITGGTGFIGSRLAESMLSRGWTVTVLDVNVERPASWWAHPDVRVIEGDVRDRDTVRGLMSSIDACWHLAAAHHDFGISEQTYFSVNEDGTRVLCDEMNRCGVSNLCFFSSVAVYGPREDRNALTPTTPYGRSKLAAESIVRDWVRGGRARALVVRPAVVFGPGNFANMYALIRQLDRNFYWPVGDGNNVKSMAYVDNLVTAVLDRWMTLDEGACPVLNYVDKPDLTSGAIAAVVAEALGRRQRAPAIPASVARPLLTTLDVLGRLAGRRLDLWRRAEKFSVTESLYTADAWPPDAERLPLEEGLRRMVEWYLSEGRRAPVRDSRPPAEVLNGARVWLADPVGSV